MKQKKTIIDDRYLQVLSMEETPVGAAVFTGPKFVIAFANPLICRMWGRIHSKVLNKPLFEVLPEASNQGFEDLLNKVLRSGVPYVGNSYQSHLNVKAEGIPSISILSIIRYEI